MFVLYRRWISPQSSHLNLYFHVQTYYKLFDGRHCLFWQLKTNFISVMLNIFWSLRSMTPILLVLIIEYSASICARGREIFCTSFTLMNRINKTGSTSFSYLFRFGCFRVTAFYQFTIFIWNTYSQEDNCLINDECYASDETRPGDVCQICRPVANSTAWSKNNSKHFINIL